MHRKLPLNRIVVSFIASAIFVSALPKLALGIAVELPLSNAFGSGLPFPPAPAIVPNNLLNDPFNYDPNLPYFAVNAVGGSVPDTNFSNTSAFNTRATNRFWGADVSLSAGDSLDWIDVWGRSNAAEGESGRHQGLTFSFFSGTGGNGSLLGTSSLFNGVSDQISGIDGSAYGRFDVSSVLSETQRTTVGSFSISHADIPDPNLPFPLLLLQEVRAATGEPEIPVPLVTINRDSGNIVIQNDSNARSLLGYSVTSAAGTLDRNAWDSLTDGTNNGSLDVDPWTKLSANITNGVNLSEGEIPGGSGGYNLAGGASIDLGPVWGKSSIEDVTVLLLNGDGTSFNPAVIYEGNSGEAFPVGDLDFDNNVDLDDWAQFRSGFGGVFATLTGAQTYAMGDFDADLDVDIDDFRAFEIAFDAANPGTSLAAAIAAPEPSTLGMLLMGSIALITGRRRYCNRSGNLLPNSKTGLKTSCWAFVFGCSLAVTSQSAIGQTFAVIDPPANPTTDVTESLRFNDSFPASNLFDATVTAADVNVTNFGGGNQEFATLGQGPVQVYIDNNQSITTNWIGFSQRNASLDHVGTIELWFSDTDFGGSLPNTPPDAVANITDFENPAVLKGFQLSNTVTGRYAALNLLRAPTGFINIGGRELRFLQGPGQFALEVNRSSGELTLKNDDPFAQSLSIDSYEISSAGSSLTSTGWNGLGGQSGFPDASAANAGDGWEQGAGSGSDLLAEAYLLGGSSVTLNAELQLGTGYNTSVDAQDLSFSYRLEDGIKLTGSVVYVGTPPAGAIGDYNNNGVVDAADYTLWRDNLGLDSSVLDNNAIAGNITSAHYDQWRNNFGNTASTLTASAVPEPQALALGAIGMALLSVRRRRLVGQRARSSSCLASDCRASSITPKVANRTEEEDFTMASYSKNQPWLSLAASVAVIAIASSVVASTPDRIYLFGDDSDTLPAGTINELGSANLGSPIGSQTGTSFDGFTLDHSGDQSVLNTFADLTPIGDPRYINVGPGGLNRAGTSGVAVGADLDGSDYLFTTQGFGNPVNGGSTYSGTYNYQGLINHYMQGWVRPAAPGAAGQRQTIIRDTDQFRIHIQADQAGVNRWGHFYSATDRTTAVEVEFDEWTHVAQFTDGNRGIFYVNGVAVSTVGGFFQPNGGGPEGGNEGARALSLGADVTGASSTPSNFFTGQLDDFDIRVTGDNSGEPNGANYGGFNPDNDNAYIANLIAEGQLVLGDVNGDLVVNGDGTGDPASDDVAFFIDHYFEQQVIEGLVVGDLNSRTMMADLNYSGTTNLLDWFILVDNHQDSALAASLDLGVLLAGGAVPEPSSLGLLGLLFCCLTNRRRHGGAR